MLTHAPDMATKDSSESLADQESAEPSAEQALPSAEHGWLQEGQELLVFVALAVLCIGVRLLWLERIEISEDMVFKWHFVRQWFHRHDFSHATWTHHMTRMGVNVPVFFVQAFTGASVRSYYAVQVVSFAAQVQLAYAIGRRLSGRGAGLIAALILCVFTGVNRDVSQLLPDGIGGTVALFTYYLVVRYQEATEEKRLPWLVGAGLAMSWNYLVKESNLLLLPGFAVAVLISRRNWRDTFLFVGVPILVMLVETAAYRTFTQYTSRFNVVSEGQGDVPVTFFGMFGRFTKLEPAWQMVFWMWVASSFALLPVKDRRVQAMLLVPAGFIFFLTFLVRSVSPLMLWTAFRSRYFSAVLPFLVLSFAVFSADALAKAWLLYVPPTLQNWRARLVPYWGFLSVALCVVVGAAVYAQARPTLDSHPFKEIAVISRVVNDAYRRNLPIVQEFKPEKLEEARARGLKAAYGVYLKEKYILQSDQAEGGRIPDILEAVHQQKNGQRQFAYVIRNSHAYRGWKQIRDLDEDGCAVRVVIESHRFFSVQPDVLPARCQAPDAAPPIPP